MVSGFLVGGGIIVGALVLRGVKEAVGSYAEKHTDLNTLRTMCIQVAWDAYKSKRRESANYRSDGTRGRISWKDGDFKIGYKQDYDWDHDEYTTDILIIPLDHSGHRLHIVYDEDGNELLNEWHTN